MSAKISQAQQDVLWKMQHGRQLVKHGMHCGNPSYFVLEINGQSEFADKRTVNSLLKRELVEYDAKYNADSPRTNYGTMRGVSVYRLTDAGRKVAA